jgi:hypothetical protein
LQLESRTLTATAAATAAAAAAGAAELLTARELFSAIYACVGSQEERSIFEHLSAVDPYIRPISSRQCPDELSALPWVEKHFVKALEQFIFRSDSPICSELEELRNIGSCQRPSVGDSDAHIQGILL